MDGSGISAFTGSRRRSLRRAVQLEADVWSELWEGAVALQLSDLSLHGAWLDSELALSVGDSVQLCFTPPRWMGLPRLEASARVVRVSLLRRRRDLGQRAGMGLCFTDLSDVSLRCLDYALRGLPPRLPAPVRERAAARFDAFGPFLELDGVSLCISAESTLLTGGRARRHTALMSAIFDSLRNA
jgi:PilZ domain-containing protein